MIKKEAEILEADYEAGNYPLTLAEIEQDPRKESSSGLVTELSTNGFRSEEAAASTIAKLLTDFARKIDSN